MRCTYTRNNIIIIIIIIIFSFMQGIYTHIPETNYVPREYSVAAILLLLFMVRISLVSVLNLLYFYISTFRSMCAVPNMAVFCSSLISWFPGMLLTYYYYYYYYHHHHHHLHLLLHHLLPHLYLTSKFKYIILTVSTPTRSQRYGNTIPT